MADSDNTDYFLRLISEDEAAEFLGYTPRSLRNLRYRGEGPPYVQVFPRLVRYTRDDLVGWYEDRRQLNTT